MKIKNDFYLYWKRLQKTKIIIKITSKMRFYLVIFQKQDIWKTTVYPNIKKFYHLPE